METTEKIVEAYLRYVKGWATIPNLRCAGQKEIDLFAIVYRTPPEQDFAGLVEADAPSQWVVGFPSDPQNVHMEKAEPTGSLVTATRLAFTAALGGFLFGYDSAVINGAVTAIGDHYHVSASGLGFTVSSALLGAAVGAVLAVAWRIGLDG